MPPDRATAVTCRPRSWPLVLSLSRASCTYVLHAHVKNRLPGPWRCSTQRCVNHTIGLLLPPNLRLPARMHHLRTVDRLFLCGRVHARHQAHAVSLAGGVHRTRSSNSLRKPLGLHCSCCPPKTAATAATHTVQGLTCLQHLCRSGDLGMFKKRLRTPLLLNS